MSALVKIVAGTAVGAGVIMGIKYFSNIKRAQTQLQIVPSVFIHQLTFEGLTLRIDALLKNPTNASFTIKYPFIEMMHLDSLIGSSQVVNKNIHIPSYGQVVIQGMMVNVPVIGVVSIIGDLIASLNNHEPVVLNVGVITTVNLGWTEIAYEHRQNVTLKN